MKAATGNFRRGVTAIMWLARPLGGICCRAAEQFEQRRRFYIKFFAFNGGAEGRVMYAVG
jgi:hypothetical protein